MEEALKLSPTSSVIIRRSYPALEVEGIYAPGGGPPPKHLHPDQDEHFEVLAGHLRARVDGMRGEQKHELGPGDTLEIPRGAAHQMWNPGESEARLTWRTIPAGRTEQWFRAIDALHREAGDDGMPDPDEVVKLLDEYTDVFRLAA